MCHFGALPLEGRLDDQRAEATLAAEKVDTGKAGCAVQGLAEVLSLAEHGGAGPLSSWPLVGSSG